MENWKNPLLTCIHFTSQPQRQQNCTVFAKISLLRLKLWPKSAETIILLLHTFQNYLRIRSCLFSFGKAI